MNYEDAHELFEIKSQNYHLRHGFFDRLREFEFHRVVLEVGSVVTENVAEAEAEFQFGDEFEVWQIEVTAESE